MKTRNFQFYRRPMILTAVALSALVTLASSSPAAPPPRPETYTGTFTRAQFISCSGQLLSPPAYSISGTWTLQIDSIRQPQVAPPAQLTMLVLRDGSPYLMFPDIELTPISAANGVYTYTYGPQVTVTLDTNTASATFSWHVEFTDNCTLRAYRSLTYIGVARNQVPFKGTVSGKIPTDLGQPLPDTGGCVFNVTVTNVGNATHLGHFTGIANFFPNVCDGSYTGTFHWIAANGDSISGPFFGQQIPTQTPGLFDNTETAIITGGTGRFTGASGTFSLGGQLNYITSSFVAPFEGTISSIGLNKKQ